jgi:hypothetical protein
MSARLLPDAEEARASVYGLLARTVPLLAKR